jgi:hypothetical protein
LCVFVHVCVCAVCNPIYFCYAEKALDNIDDLVDRAADDNTDAMLRRSAMQVSYYVAWILNLFFFSSDISINLYVCSRSIYLLKIGVVPLDNLKQLRNSSNRFSTPTQLKIINIHFIYIYSEAKITDMEQVLEFSEGDLSEYGIEKAGDKWRVMKDLKRRKEERELCA